jgi:hypothetical protein
MRSLLSLSLLSVLLSCPPAPAAPTYHALLIGVSKYDSPHLNDLDYADKDVEDLAEVLKDSGYKGANVVVLNTGRKGASPTPERIKAQLKKFLEGNYNADDVVLIAFSGHGIQVGNKFFFCPAGARVDNPADLISIDELYRRLGKCKAGYRVVLTDACRNDPAKKVPAIPVRITHPAQPQYDQGLPKNVFLFASCTPGTKSYESKELAKGRGVYFHFVIEGLKGKADLNGDGKVNRAELDAYVLKAMADHDKRQIPESVNRSTKNPTLVVIPDRPRDVPRPVASLPRDKDAYVPNLALSHDGKWAVSYACKGFKKHLQFYDLEKRVRVKKGWFGSSAAPCNLVFVKDGFVKDGRVAVGELNGYAEFDLQGQRVMGLKVTSKAVRSIAPSHTGRVAIGGNDGILTVKDARTEQTLATFEHGSRDAVTLACFDHGGERVLSGTSRGKVFLWDVAKGRQVHSLSGGRKDIVAGLITADGAVALTVAAGGDLLRWDLKAGKEIDRTDLSRGGEKALTACFTPDGRRLMVGGERGTVSFWDVPPPDKGKPKLRGSFKKHDGGCGVALAPDGRRALSADATELWLYEVP